MINAEDKEIAMKLNNFVESMGKWMKNRNDCIVIFSHHNLNMNLPHIRISMKNLTNHRNVDMTKKAQNLCNISIVMIDNDEELINFFALNK